MACECELTHHFTYKFFKLFIDESNYIHYVKISISNHIFNHKFRINFS